MKRHIPFRFSILRFITLIVVTSAISPELRAQPFVFSQTFSGKEVVFIANGDFSYIRQPFGEDTSWWDPVFSPNGKYLAYFRGEPGAGMDLWMVNIGSTSIKRLTHLGTNYGSHPSWHPDGNQILFESAPVDNKYESEIRIVNTDGTN